MLSGNDAIVLQCCVAFMTEIGHRLWNCACALPSIVAGWSARTRFRVLKGTSAAESLRFPHGLVQTFSLTPDSRLNVRRPMLRVVRNIFGVEKMKRLVVSLLLLHPGGCHRRHWCTIIRSVNSVQLNQFNDSNQLLPVNPFHSFNKQQQTQRQQQNNKKQQQKTNNNDKLHFTNRFQTW